jgi:ferredoxin
MDDAPVSGIHGLERDDLTLFDRLLPEALCHRCERCLASEPVAFRIHHDVSPILTWSIDRSMSEELQRGKDLPPLADDAARIAAIDFDDDFRQLPFDFDFTRPTEPGTAVHAHLLKKRGNKVKRFVGAFIAFVLRSLIVAGMIWSPSAVVIASKLTALSLVVLIN